MNVFSIISIGVENKHHVVLITDEITYNTPPVAHVNLVLNIEKKH